MLILTRNLGDTLFVEHGGSVFEVKILGIYGRQVRLGISAPVAFTADRFSANMRCCNALMGRVRTKDYLPKNVYLAMCAVCQTAYLVDEQKRQRVTVRRTVQLLLDILGGDQHQATDSTTFFRHLADLKPTHLQFEKMYRVIAPWLQELKALPKMQETSNETK